MENSHLPETVYENLPEFLKEITSPFDGRERDIVLLSSIGVLSACLPKIFGIYDGRRFYPNLFLLIVAPPASGKGVMNSSKSLIEKIHHYIKDASIFEIEECEQEQKGKKHTNQKCPELEIKIIPGNVSSAKFYKHIKNSNPGVLVFETEADTISTMLKQDWGNFSDVLRKSFQHETISISRDTDDKYFEISNPKLSLVLSGTPDQVRPLIQSKENGLFSRFLFYCFDDATGWKDISPNGVKTDYHQLFTNSGEEIFCLYEKLINNEVNIEIQLTDFQWETINSTMTLACDAFIKEKKLDIIPILKRHGVMIFRICMILTTIRLKENNSFENIIFCEDQDFQCALEIIKSSIDHSIKVSSLLSNETDKNGKPLTVNDIIFYSELPENFERKKAVEIGITNNIPTRTVDFLLKKGIKDKRLIKIKNGAYKRAT
ncbi:conserved hypothetical protein [Flavobacterium psychrophilum]|uniref:DUF3987 domain-containing protein n=1 Tax=Flavobacterium psychrophilum TaxID=96345 RepID=UPI000B7C19C9|nr:DUF3987 domain-containing protein [Flavobacterium psychrophilum]SNB31327.1 conserved hypothetical protein [Flavobacterium psychrophilum]